MASLAIDLLSQPTNDGKPAAAVKCPVCDGVCPGPALYRYTAEQAAAHFCPPTQNADRNRRLRESIERLWKGNDCEIVRCDQCGFAFGQPFVGGDESFYSILLEEKSYPSWRWDYELALAALEQTRPGKILDIGAGVGMFLRGLGKDWQRFAVESSEVTRRELEQSGIEVFRDLAEAARSHAGTFRVVTLFQVLEHIAEFDLVLEQCRQLLEPGGKLVITVPDGEAMIRQERLTGCHDMPPNHINKWTGDSLTRVLRRNGFEPGRPVVEPRSWNALKANLHMRIRTDATNPNSLTAAAYRIRNRRLRIAVLALLAGPAMARMLPARSQLRQGGAFGLISEKIDVSRT
ncbi:MAG TPA: class I SAM-dependent methyltransferase [Pyrinomonadaceae bacterium]